MSFQVVLFVVMVVIPRSFELEKGFLRSPTNTNATLNATISFECLYNSSQVSYSWIVNDTLFDVLSPPDGISFEVFNGIQIMSVFCDESRNFTRVVCSALLEDDTVINSEEATLLIQGHLGKVKNLTAIAEINSIILTWIPPYSLDITEVDPDFTHTVEVYNITSRGRSLVYTIQHITDSTFTFSLVNPNPSDLFEFIVYAVNAAGRGEPSHPVQGRFEEVPTMRTAYLTEDTRTTKVSNTVSTVDIDQTTVHVPTVTTHHTRSTSAGLVTNIVICIASLVVGAVLALLIIAIIICVRHHHRSFKRTSGFPAPNPEQGLEAAESYDIEMKRCGAYGVATKKHRIRSVQVTSPAAYEIVD